MILEDPATNLEQNDEQTDYYICAHLVFIFENKNFTKGKAQNQVCRKTSVPPPPHSICMSTLQEAFESDTQVLSYFETCAIC
jgi:hypothetical protein